MPKNYFTRKMRARDLLALLEKGPAFSAIGADPFTPESASEQYEIWAKSWVIDDLIDLVPELRQIASEKGAS